MAIYRMQPGGNTRPHTGSKPGPTGITAPDPKPMQGPDINPGPRNNKQSLPRGPSSSGQWLDEYSRRRGPVSQQQRPMSVNYGKPPGGWNQGQNGPPQQSTQPTGQRLGGMASSGLPQQFTQPTGQRLGADLGGNLKQPPQQSVQPIGQRLGGQMSNGGGALEQAIARRQGAAQSQPSNNLSVLLGMLR